MKRSNGRGGWRWDQEKEEGRGGDRRWLWLEEGGGEPWTVSARVTGAQVPAPRGMWWDRGPQGGPPDPSRALSPLGRWPNSLHPILGWGP